MEFFQKKLELADESLALLLREPVFIALEVEEASGRHHAEKRVQLKRFQSKLKSLEEEKKYWMDAIQSATKDLSQSTNHQVADPCPPSHQDDLTAALSCLKFLDAIAVKLTEFYDFELKDPSYISLGGILDAIDNWKWDFRFKLGERVTSKSPHHIFSEDEKRSQELWNVLRALNSKTMRRIHDRCLLKTGNGNALLAISRTEYSLDRVQDLKDIGLAMGLVDDKDDLTVVCSPSGNGSVC